MRERICFLLVFSVSLCAQTYDTVLANGRVMDPESGLDAIRYIGIRGKRIEAISATPLQGKSIVDVRGLVAAPGFIDAHDGKNSSLPMRAFGFPGKSFHFLKLFNESECKDGLTERLVAWKSDGNSDNAKWTFKLRS